MANSSIPASLRFFAGGMTSSWDFPSVINMPILGTPGLEPASGLKLFSKIKVKARPGHTEERREKEEVDQRYLYCYGCKNMSSFISYIGSSHNGWLIVSSWLTDKKLLLILLKINMELIQQRLRK